MSPIQLKWFASTSSANKQTGYVALLEPNGTRTYFEGISNDNNGQLLLQPEFLFTLAFQYTACLGLSMLLPLIFVKIGILPSPDNKEIDLSFNKGTDFLAIIITGACASVGLIVFDIFLYINQLHGSASVAVLFLLLPLALPCVCCNGHLYYCLLLLPILQIVQKTALVLSCWWSWICNYHHFLTAACLPHWLDASSSYCFCNENHNIDTCWCMHSAVFILCIPLHNTKNKVLLLSL